jgi:hypothetical protein
MPVAHAVQYTQYVDDGEPWTYLRGQGFHQKLGVMTSPVSHLWNDEERGAVHYLCEEWGWTMNGPEH